MRNFSDCLIPVNDFLMNLVEGVLELFEQHSLAFNKEKIAEAILLDLQSIWQKRFDKVFALELYQAKKDNLLKGKTPEERYQYFLDALAQKQNQTFFLQRYPVLKQHLAIFSKHYFSAFETVCARLKQDIHELSEVFKQNFPSFFISNIRFMGDPHRYYQRVAVIEFTNNESIICTLVYKPRNIKNEVFFNHVIEWLNVKSNSTLKTLQFLDKNDYGWCEYVKKEECNSVKDAEKYYYRFGMLTALTYVLSVTDMHYENLIASGSQPVIIDLECFSVDVFSFEKSQDKISTVLNSGMLPNYIIERNAAMDSSAFSGGGEECEIPFEQASLKNIGRDDVYIEKNANFFSLQANRPVLNGKAINPYLYKGKVLDGFVATYNILLQYKKEFLTIFSTFFPLLQARLVFRSTVVYMKLFLESYHPSLLKSPREYAKHMAWLKSHLVTPKAIKGFFESELLQLTNQDVPLFLLTKNKIYDAYGNCVSSNIQNTISKAIQKKFKKLSLANLNQQLGIIEKSLDTYSLNYMNSNLQQYQEALSKPSETNFKEKLILTLDQLFNDCAENKAWIWPEHRKTEVKGKFYWILYYEKNLSLYSGTAGILLTLSFMLRLAPQKKYVDWLNSGIFFIKNIVTKQLKTMQGSILDFSLFNGLGGIIYLCTNCLGMGLDECLHDIINCILKLMQKGLEEWLQTYQFDIISGIAGLLLALDILIKKNIQLKRSVHLMKRCKAFLLEHYPNPAKLPKQAQKGQTTKALLGFSHGVSGIAYALYRTERLNSPDKKVIRWVKKALAYERKCFNLNYQGWPNFYTEHKQLSSDQKTLFQNDWCHGSLGIALSRLELKKLGWTDPYINQEIAISILSLKAAQPQLSLNLCHGALGRFDFYIRLKKEDLIDTKSFESERSNILNTIMQANRLLTETNTKVFIPGLMTGQAGIVYEGLRALYPELVPSILSIDSI